MPREQTINQLKHNWIQLEIIKKKITNELWILEVRIEKIKSKLKNYGMDESMELDQELVAIWEDADISGGDSSNCSNTIRSHGM